MVADALAPLGYLTELGRLDPSYSKGEVLGPMTTGPPRLVIGAFKSFVDTNLNGPPPFSRAAALEREVVEHFSAYSRLPVTAGL